jgi:hypothetical protein
VRAYIHMDECSYMYEYLCLYYISKKIIFQGIMHENPLIFSVM